LVAGVRFFPDGDGCHDLNSFFALGIVVVSNIDLVRTYARSDAIVQITNDLGRAQIVQSRKAAKSFKIFTTTYNYGCDYLPYDASAPYDADEAGYTGYLDEQITVATDPALNTTWFFNSRGMLVDSSGNLTTGDLDLKITARDGSGTFNKYADVNILTTGVVSYTLVD
jgi:hypothetical protein